MDERITTNIHIEVFDLAWSDFVDLMDRIEEVAAAHKAEVTVDGNEDATL